MTQEAPSPAQQDDRAGTIHYWTRAGTNNRTLPIFVLAAVVLGSLLIWSQRGSGLIVCRMNANEAAAVATLKNIYAAQQQARAQSALDVDRDGQGGVGFVGELAADKPGPSGKRLDEPLLHPEFAIVQNLGRRRGGGVRRSGYYFQVFLARTDGAWIAERAQGGRPSLPPGSQWREDAFLCYAWPESIGDAGRRAFLVTQDGEVLACRNDTTRYDRDHLPPPGRAGFLAPGRIAANTTALDGQRWIAVQ